MSSTTGNDRVGSADRTRALEEQLRAVRAIGEALATSVGLDALFHKIVPEVTHLMRADRSTLFLVDASNRQIWSKIAQGEGGREIRLDIGRGIAGWVAEHKEAVNIPDAYDDFRFNPDVDRRTGYRTRSVAAVPLVDRKDALIGVLQVLNHEGGPFNDDDIGLLNTIGVQIGYAVENARQAQELLDSNKELEAARHRAERRRAELDLLYQLEQESSASTDLDQLLDSVIVRTCERLRSEAGSVLLSDAHTGRLFFRGVTGERKDELKQLSLESGEGIVGWVAQTASSVIVNRPEEDPRHDIDLAQKLEYPAKALMAVPLVWDDQVIGAVEVLNPRPRPTGATAYDEDDLKVLTLIAGQVSRAVALTRQRQERLEHERLAFLGRLLAGVAHDLRNPMTVISGYAQIMAMEENSDKREERCNRILTQIDEMTAMIADLLAFARGDTKLNPTVVPVEELASELEEALGVHCNPRGIELVIHAKGKTARLDLGRVKRIVHNLAKNAVDVLGRGGRLQIDMEEKDGGLNLDVQDSGPGIPEEIKAKMFDAFVSSGKRSGTGLGLSIVKRFVADHGGSILVESTPGQGTKFTVHLPAAEMEPEQ